MLRRSIETAFHWLRNVPNIPSSTPNEEATMGLTNSFNAVLVGAAFAFVALMLFI